MPLLIPHPILHATRSPRTPRDIHTLAGAVVSAKSEGSQNQTRSLARAIGLTWLFLFMTMQPNSAFADQPNFDSHSNQDALDFSDHRQTKRSGHPRQENLPLLHPQEVAVKPANQKAQHLSCCWLTNLGLLTTPPLQILVTPQGSTSPSHSHRYHIKTSQPLAQFHPQAACSCLSLPPTTVDDG